jgi:hypothetical protein
MPALNEALQRHWRRRRMEAFLRLLRPRPGARVIDLGGRPDIWELVDVPLDITLLNLADDIATWPARAAQRITIVTGDACSASMFADGAFDIAFSNGVLEHLPAERHGDFAATVRRLAPAWWVQTPSPSFPVEVHCKLPLWWSYPPALRAWWIERWRRRGRDFLAQQMLTTCGVPRRSLQALFPGARIMTERVLGLPKSYCAFNDGGAGGRAGGATGDVSGRGG